MIAALRYETVRVLTVRSTWICLVLTVVGVTGLAFLAAQPFGDPGGGTVVVLWWEAFAQPLLLTAIIASVVAAQNIGQEYRFGLIRLTLTAFPQRARILTAKLVSVVVVALVFAVVSYLSSWLGVTLHGYPTPPAAASAVDSTFLLRGAVFLVLWCLSAWALAGLTRQTAIGIAVPLVSGFIIEQILGGILRDRASWLVDVLPWSSGMRWSSVASDVGDGTTSGPPVGWSAVGVFSCWILALVIAEIIVFLRRDA